MAKVYQPQDKFFKKAKEEGYRARSAFKLEAIQNRFKIIKPSAKVLDLGAAPGSFLQFISRVIGEKGLAVGVDLKVIESVKASNVFVYQGDIFDEPVFDQIEKDTGVSLFDVITSDLAPATTGVKSVDAGRSFQLNEQVLLLSDTHLKKGGHVVMKAFPGAEHDELLRLTKERFKNLKLFKPAAVRQSSREVYVVGMGRV